MLQGREGMGGPRAGREEVALGVDHRSGQERHRQAGGAREEGANEQRACSSSQTVEAAIGKHASPRYDKRREGWRGGKGRWEVCLDSSHSTLSCRARGRQECSRSCEGVGASCAQGTSRCCILPHILPASDWNCSDRAAAVEGATRMLRGTTKGKMTRSMTWGWTIPSTLCTRP